MDMLGLASVRYGAPNRSFLSSHIGPDGQGVEYEALRDGYAKQNFGKPKVAGEKKFFDLVKGQYEGKQKRWQAASDVEN